MPCICHMLYKLVCLVLELVQNCLQILRHRFGNMLSQHLHSATTACDMFECYSICLESLVSLLCKSQLSSHLYFSMWACKWSKSMRFSWPESQPLSSAVSPTWGHPVSPLLRHSTPPSLNKAAKSINKVWNGRTRRQELTAFSMFLPSCKLLIFDGDGFSSP